jgi:hypothetical protein
MAIRTATAIKQIKAMGYDAFHHDGEGDVVKVCCEHDDDSADYFEGMHRSEMDDFGINLKLQAWAKKNGLFWEWQNAGCIAAYRV